MFLAALFLVVELSPAVESSLAALFLAVQPVETVVAQLLVRHHVQLLVPHHVLLLAGTVVAEESLAVQLFLAAA